MEETIHLEKSALDCGGNENYIPLHWNLDGFWAFWATELPNNLINTRYVTPGFLAHTSSTSPWFHRLPLERAPAAREVAQ